MPSHCYRMRVFDRDLIRGGHYGQRSCEPHLKAEHMAAPTNAANVKKALANSEPSTHGTFETCHDFRIESALGEKRKLECEPAKGRFRREAVIRYSKAPVASF